MAIKEKTNQKTEYYAFFDAEYTCYMKEDRNFDKKHNSEVLSVGLVITDKKFRIKKTFYSAIRPKYNPILTGYCKALTGLTQREVDRAPNYETVFQKMSKLLAKYPVKEIFVWGSDRSTLEDDIVKNHTSVASNHKKIVHKITDITKRLTFHVYGRGITVGLADMKYICDLKREVGHNALSDAKDLYYVSKIIMEKKYNKEKAENLQRYLKNRDNYHKYRRFKKTFIEEEGVHVGASKQEEKAFRKLTENYIKKLKENLSEQDRENPSVKALCDDLRVLADMEIKDFPRLM